MSRLSFDPDERQRLLRRALTLLVGALASVGAVAAVGIRFEDAESRRAMDREQRRLEGVAGLLAAELGAELRALPVGPDDEPGTLPPGLRVADLIHAADYLATLDERVLIAPGPDASFLDLHQQPVRVHGLHRPDDDGLGSTLLPAEAAATLSLPGYPVIFAAAPVDAGTRGRWWVGLAGSTRQEVERDHRGMLRVVLKVLLTGVIVAAFGYFAFRNFRDQLLAHHALLLAEERRASEAVLAREARTATLLTLAGGVAHEVGTPLGLIRVKAEALRDLLVDTPEADDATDILHGVQRVRDVVQGFLQVARGQAPEQSSIDPAELVRIVAGLVKHRFEAAEVGLTLRVAASPPAVHGSQLLIEHALVNLLINACDASPPGATVTLAVRAEDGQVTFEVRDEGAGVRPEDQARLMEPFFTRKAHGTGLGLSITHEIARMHRGDVTLAPRAPRGTVATLRLPREAP